MSPLSRIERVVTLASAYYGYSVAEVLSSSTNPELQSVRAIIAYLLRGRGQMNHSEIARLLDISPGEVGILIRGAQQLRGSKAARIKLLGYIIRPPILGRISELAKAEMVIDVVAIHFGTSAEYIKGKSRKHSLVEARHIAMALIKETTSLSISAIGRLFSRDHSTVLYALKRVERAPQLNLLRGQVCELLVKAEAP